MVIRVFAEELRDLRERERESASRGLEVVRVLKDLNIGSSAQCPLVLSSCLSSIKALRLKAWPVQPRCVMFRFLRLLTVADALCLELRK